MDQESARDFEGTRAAASLYGQRLDPSDTPAACCQVRLKFSTRKPMHEHAVQTAIGIRAVTEFDLPMDDRLPPRFRQLPKTLIFFQRGPPMMDVQQQAAARTNHPVDVFQHLTAILTPLNHPEGAEQADGMICGMISQTVKLDEIGSEERNASVAGNSFLAAPLEHRLAQIDPNHSVSAIGQGDRAAAASTA